MKILGFFFFFAKFACSTLLRGREVASQQVIECPTVFCLGQQSSALFAVLSNEPSSHSQCLHSILNVTTYFQDLARN